MALAEHPNARTDFKRLLGAMQTIAKCRSDQTNNERPDSQLLNSLDWYKMDAIESLSKMNSVLSRKIGWVIRHSVKLEGGTELSKDDNWDQTLQLCIGQVQFKSMSTETAEKVKQNDKALEQVWIDMQDRINTNKQLMNKLRGNVPVVKFGTRTEIGTRLQQAERETEAALVKHSPNKGKQAGIKEMSAKLAELALADSNQQMRRIKDTVVQLLEQATVCRMITQREDQAEDTEEVGGAQGEQDGEICCKQDPKLELQLETVRQELETVKIELQT